MADGQAPAGSAPELGAMLSRLLADPDLIGRIADAAGLPPGPTAEEKGGSAAQLSAAAEDAAGCSLPPPRGDNSTGGRQNGPRNGPQSGCDRRTALLRALRPYCGERRQKAIDTMITLSRLTDSLEELGGPNEGWPGGPALTSGR